MPGQDHVLNTGPCRTELMMTAERLVLAGIQLTVLATFLTAYGGTDLALPGFGLAVIGTFTTAYGLLGDTASSEE